MEPQNEDEALTCYVLSHYERFFTRLELLAWRNVFHEAKATAYGSPSAEHIRERYVSKDPEVERLLADGVAAFRIRVRDRLLAEHGHEIHLNRCPKCGALTRTPTACLCPVCNQTWYELRNKRSA